MTHHANLTDLQVIDREHRSALGAGESRRAVVIDVFSPIRSHRDARPTVDRTTPRWP